MSDFTNIENIISDARNGKMYILVDSEDRENEGDLIIPASLCKPEHINFMATYGRGLICLSISETRAKELKLPPPNFNLSEVFEGRGHQGRRVRHRFISNAKARERLDWQPRYPSYREGYAEFLA